MRSLLHAASTARPWRREKPKPPQAGTAAFRLNTYEYIPGGGELALVRVVGQLDGVSPDEIVLRDAAGERHPPLPAARPSEPAERGLWRAAFSVPLESVEGGQLVLTLGGGGEVPLPTPTRRSLGIEDGPRAQATRADADAAGRLPQIDRRDRPAPAHEAAGVRTEKTEPATGEGERRLVTALEDANGKREDLEHRCRQAEAQVTELRTRLQAVAAEAQRQREAAELQRHDVELLREELERQREAAARAPEARAERRAGDLEAAERRLADYVQRLATAAEIERGLRARIESLESRPVGDAGVVTPTEAESGGSERHEATVVELRARIAELEHAAEARIDPDASDAQELDRLRHALDAQRVIEDDLRAMLASAKRQADEARREVAALRGTLANSPRRIDRREPVKAPDDEDWSALDQDLIERLTKAKQLSGSD